MDQFLTLVITMDTYIFTLWGGMYAVHLLIIYIRNLYSHTSLFQ